MSKQKKLIQMKRAAFVSIWHFAFSRRAVLAILCLFLTSSCTWVPRHQHYRDCYAHLHEELPESECSVDSTEFSLIICTNARHLDYSDSRNMLRTLAKHPAHGTKSGDVGHAWIYLKGQKEGQFIVIEGGHSGETGTVQPKYTDGVMNYMEYGYLDPTEEEKLSPRFEPNPVRYLWEPQVDGYFQQGNGGHLPTFAAHIPLTEEEFDRIYHFLNPQNYDYSHYSLSEKQCSTLVAKVAELIDFPLEHEVDLQIASSVEVLGKDYHLWEDPQYSTLTLSSPDIIERSLMQAVREGRAVEATDWYHANNRRPLKKRLAIGWRTIKKFPERITRAVVFW